MRIQILELPMKHLGEASETPFAIVFDGVENPNEFLDQLDIDKLKAHTGANAVLAFNCAVEID